MLTTAKLTPSYLNRQELDEESRRQKGCPGLRGNGHNQKDINVLGIMTYSPVVSVCSFLPKQSFYITGSQNVPEDPTSPRAPL